MILPKNIETIISNVDKIKTIDFYSTQNLIQDDCTCEDCIFYETEFIKFPFEIYKELDNLGVDLRKNINDESTGVWIVREKEVLVYCEPAYRLYGNFQNTEERVFEIIENNYKVTIQVYKNDNSFITLYLTFDKLV